MNKELLLQIDDYIERLFVPVDGALTHALEAGEQRGLPAIHVSPTEGRLLYILARIVSPKRVLEVGTLAGYSTIWLAKALQPGAQLITIELDSDIAFIARENLSRAGVAQLDMEVRVGDARRVMKEMCDDGTPPFDLIFIDADKESYPDYLAWSMRLSRPGTVILTDNLLRNGAVISPDKAHHRALARVNAELAANSRLDSTIVAVINRYTIDGLGISIVGEPPQADAGDMGDVGGSGGQ